MTKEDAKAYAERVIALGLNDETQAFCEMAIKALETVEDFERAQIITGGRLNGRTYAYKCGLEDGKRKALEQHCEDCKGILTKGMKAESSANKIIAEVEWERKWLSDAGYNAHNIDMAFASIIRKIRKELLDR